METLLITGIVLFVAYFVFIIGMVLNLAKATNYKSFKIISPPKVSILVAVRNEEKNIAHFIDQLITQTYKFFEVIIIDDHSTDKTLEQIQKVDDFRIDVYSLPMGKNGKKEALKYGLNFVTSDWVVFTDADVYITSDWLTSYIAHFKNKAFILAPVFIKTNKNTFFQLFQQLDFAAMQYITIASVFARKTFMCNGANMALDTQTARQIYADFNTAIPSGDDVFVLHEHLKNKGQIRLNLCPSSIVYIEPQKSLSELINQRLRWASKAKYYKNSMALFVSLIVFLPNFYLILLSVGTLFFPPLSIALILFFFIKIMIDFPLFYTGNKIIPLNRKWIFYYPFISFIYFLYISTVGISSLFAPINWKNRKWENNGSR